jgi:predicted DNA-binding protein
MTQMIRKHFLLPLPLDERIKLVARQDQKSEAEVIRELIEQGLQATKPSVSLGEGLRQLANLGIKGPSDLSQNIDKYLYEEDAGE